MCTCVVIYKIYVYMCCIQDICVHMLLYTRYYMCMSTCVVVYKILHMCIYFAANGNFTCIFIHEARWWEEICLVMSHSVI